MGIFSKHSISTNDGKSGGLSLGSTPSHGNPSSTSALNTELNNVARNTDDTAKARALVAAGAQLDSTNGPHWRHTPLHQAAYHGRHEMAACLVELGAPLELPSNPCGRGRNGTPLELARGGGHERIAEMIERALEGGVRDTKRASSAKGGSIAEGRWEVYKNIDMCFQGDAEIIHDWKRHTSIAKLKKVVEEKNYSAVCVGSFGHAALKSFDYQLTKEHCKPSQGYTNELHIWFPTGKNAKREMMPAPRPALPAGFRFQDGFGEATRGDQIGHIKSGGIESHCFKGDKMNWPLQWAAMIGDLKAIDALVAAGHDPNVKMTDWFDSEPLGWAASFGQCKAIEALCEAGADPSRPANLAGETPLSDAQREGHKKAIELINQYLSKARPCDVSSTGHGGAAAGDNALLDGHYFSFQTGGDPRHVVDRFEARQAGNRVTYYRNGHVGSTGRVDPATAHACESYEIRGDQLIGPVTATVQKNGDITYSHGYTSRKEDARPCVVSSTGQLDGTVVHTRPGMRLTWKASHDYATEMGGRLLTLEEARDHLRGSPLCAGDDQWCAVGTHSERDWVQVGSRHHHAGKSHVHDCLHYPPWGDDANNRTYGAPSWNYVALYLVPSASAQAAAPKEVVVRGAGIWWCNDTWTLQSEERNGRPYWRRNGNRTDCLAYAPSRQAWTLSGTPGAGDADVYVCRSDAPLPPKGGWKARGGGGSFGASVPSPAPALDYTLPKAHGGRKRSASSSSSSSATAADGERLLFETVDVLRRELTLKGTVRQVVTQACAQLGVDVLGKAVTQQANECWEIVMGK